MSAIRKRTDSKRELLGNRAGDFFTRRTGSGQFKELHERGRSLAVDRRQRAKTTVPAGQGDRGDQKRAPAKKRATASRSKKR